MTNKITSEYFVENTFWRWRLLYRGRPIAYSQVGYRTLTTCRRSLFKLVERIKVFGIRQITTTYKIKRYEKVA